MCVNRVWGVMLWNGWFAWEMITGRVKEWGLGQKMVICSEEQNVNLMWMEGIIPFLVLIEGDANLLSAQRTRQFLSNGLFKEWILRGIIHYGLREGRDWSVLNEVRLRVFRCWLFCCQKRVMGNAIRSPSLDGYSSCPIDTREARVQRAHLMTPPCQFERNGFASWVDKREWFKKQ